jgi:hypothetical protein
MVCGLKLNLAHLLVIYFVVLQGRELTPVCRLVMWCVLVALVQEVCEFLPFLFALLLGLGHSADDVVAKGRRLRF